MSEPGPGPGPDPGCEHFSTRENPFSEPTRKNAENDFFWGAKQFASGRPPGRARARWPTLREAQARTCGPRPCGRHRPGPVAPGHSSQSLDLGPGPTPGVKIFASRENSFSEPIRKNAQNNCFLVCRNFLVGSATGPGPRPGQEVGGQRSGRFPSLTPVRVQGPPGRWGKSQKLGVSDTPSF